MRQLAGSSSDIAKLVFIHAEVVTELVNDGAAHLLANLPLAAAAPEWYSEKAATIACYAVASGIFTVLGPTPPILGSKNIVKLATEGLEKIVGATFAVQPDPEQAAQLICSHIEKKRAALGLSAKL